MEKLIVINGSPKPKYSASGLLISQIEVIAGEAFPVYQATKLLNQESPAAAVSELLRAATLLIVFPLYIDALPAPLIQVLTLLDQGAALAHGQLPRVYAIGNCGFYEAENNRLALDIIQNFCRRSGLGWGYGIGIGAGGSLTFPSQDFSQGPTSNVYKALREMVTHIQKQSAPTQNVFLTPNIPRESYLKGANKAWEQAAEKYNQKANLNARPHTQGQ